MEHTTTQTVIARNETKWSDEAIAFMFLVLFCFVFFVFGESLEGVSPPLRIKKGGFALVLIKVVSKGVSPPLRIEELSSILHPKT